MLHSNTPQQPSDACPQMITLRASRTSLLYRRMLTRISLQQACWQPGMCLTLLQELMASLGHAGQEVGAAMHPHGVHVKTPSCTRMEVQPRTCTLQ